MSHPADPKNEKKETTTTPAPDLSSTGTTPMDTDPWPSTAPPPPKK